VGGEGGDDVEAVDLEGGAAMNNDSQDNEAMAAARMVLHGMQKPKPSHIMCVGWPTIKRLMAGEAVWFEDLQCGAVAADDLLNAQQSVFAMELLIVQLQTELRRQKNELNPSRR
jgi:hypothetical protein